MSKGLEGLQFFGTGPTDQLLATFVVAGEVESSPVDIASMTFTLPLANDRNIEESEITVKRTVTFDIVGNASIVPFPQFLVNRKAYQNDIPMYDLTLDGHAEEWTIVSTQNATHPFHIHVLPFQVKSAHTNNTNPRYNDFVNQSKSGNIWRDVDLIPPYGTVKVWLRLTPSAYTNLNGKSVFHCHFLAHEDTRPSSSSTPANRSMITVTLTKILLKLLAKALQPKMTKARLTKVRLPTVLPTQLVKLHRLLLLAITSIIIIPW